MAKQVIEEGFAPEKAKTIEAQEPAMNTEQLLLLLAQTQKQLLEIQKQNAEASRAQTEAILELAKPKAPVKTEREIAQEKNDELFKKQQREQEERTRINIKYSQDNCEHIAGSNALSEQKDIAGRTSIIWHRGDVGQVTGICTVCQRIFKQSDPDFAQWRRKKSFNKDSASGFRTVMDPVAAIEKSYLHDIA